MSMSLFLLSLNLDAKAINIYNYLTASQKSSQFLILWIPTFIVRLNDNTTTLTTILNDGGVMTAVLHRHPQYSGKGISFGLILLA